MPCKKKETETARSCFEDKSFQQTSKICLSVLQFHLHRLSHHRNQYGLSRGQVQLLHEARGSTILWLQIRSGIWDTKLTKHTERCDCRCKATWLSFPQLLNPCLFQRGELKSHVLSSASLEAVKALNE